MLAPASPSSALAGAIAFEASEETREQLSTLGRTEDVRLSPGGTRLAVACYARHQVAVVDIEIVRASGGAPSVALGSPTFHDSPSVEEPHGLDFVDDDTLVVASRSGSLTVLRLPPVGSSGAARTIGARSCALGAAGSVSVWALGEGEAELLVVHNWTDTVARYQLGPDGSITGAEAVARRRLHLPDGLAESADGEWLAISNHDTQDVLVFRRSDLHSDAEPVGVLRGVSYPHGLRFAHDGTLLLVADAGAPYVSVFSSPSASWAGVSYPEKVIRAMDDETFAAGRHNPQEGGPKGIDLDERTGVLVVTAETLALAFFDFPTALDAASRPSEDELVRYELERIAALERMRAETTETREQLSAVLGTKAWRLTAPLRTARGRVRRR